MTEPPGSVAEPAVSRRVELSPQISPTKGSLSAVYLSSYDLSPRSSSLVRLSLRWSHVRVRVEAQRSNAFRGGWLWSAVPPMLFLLGCSIDCCVHCCFPRSSSSLVIAAAFLCLPLAGNYSGAFWDCNSSWAEHIETFFLCNNLHSLWSWMGTTLEFWHIARRKSLAN